MDSVTAHVWASGRIPGERDVAAGSTTSYENYERRSNPPPENNRNGDGSEYKEDIVE